MYVDLKRPTFETILCRSAATLRVLHLEHTTTLEMIPVGMLLYLSLKCVLLTQHRAMIIGKMLRNLRYLTVIVPDVVALQATNVEMAGLIDSASAQPLLTLEYLYATGSKMTFRPTITRKP